MKRLRLTTMLLAMCLLQACGNAAPDDRDGAIPDSGKGPSEDASRGVDAAATVDTGMSACSDDPTTPGNDCPDAVGCREAPACGLDTQSCCVPGFNTGAVACVEGSQCEEGSRTLCDGPEDCDGRACCVDIAKGEASCAAGLVCEQFQLCHGDADCADAKSCAAGTSFTWWGICS